MREARRVAGWYDDERDPATLRYWDGASWTPHTTARPEAEPVVAAEGTVEGGTVGGGTVGARGVVEAGTAGAAGAAGGTVGAGTATVSLGVTEVRSPGLRGATAGAASRRDASSARDAAGAPPAAPRFPSSPHPGSTTPVPVDTLVDDFSISEMTSARSAAKPSVTAVAASATPIAMAPPTFAAAPSFATTPAPGAPDSFTRMPAAPNEHTTAPLPPTGFIGASAAGSTAGAAGPEGRSFVVIWLFALLLGSLGVDRFALGKPGTAVAKLLSAGGFGVWTLVDLVLVLTGAQRDRDGNPLAGYAAHRRLAWIVSGFVIGLGVLLSIVTGIAVMNLGAGVGQVGAR